MRDHRSRVSQECRAELDVRFIRVSRLHESKSISKSGSRSSEALSNIPLLADESHEFDWGSNAYRSYGFTLESSPNPYIAIAASEKPEIPRWKMILRRRIFGVVPIGLGLV